MFRTKKEVDAHVRTALSKIRTETERHLRSLTVAKLYFKINEYASAEQYLTSYMSVKKDNDQAHKLLGQCYQRLKKPEKALQSYQLSLQLNPKQPDVLAEVCQLLLDDKNLDCNKAKYWCELAESEKVQHEAVFSLRLKLMNKDNNGSNQVEELIQKEIAARPDDVQLRVRLLRNYVEKNQILDAFKYVHQLEMSQKDEFVTSGEWYNIVWLVLNKYEKISNIKKDWDFWLLVAMCLERQVLISFYSTTSSTIVGGGVTETANLLFNFDQYLYKISQLSDKFCAQKELIELFLDHYRGQLLLHASALIFKRELLQNKNKWKESTRAALPLLLLAYQIEAPDNNKPWMKHCDEQSKQLICLWHREASFRCAQAGRTLLSCINDDTSVDKENAHSINYLMGGQSSNLWQSNDELLSQVRQTCSDRQWRHNIFAFLFCNSDQKVKEQSSLFTKSSKMSEPRYELPSHADVERYEEDAQYLRPQSLQHMVYLCLGNDNLAHVRAKYFSGLNFSTHNLSFCGAESLNQLDIDSFLYAATIQANRALEVEREAFDSYQSGNSIAAGKPKILPFVNLQNILCSEEQFQWWNSAYMVYKNLSNGNNLAELRANLQYGIEAVRGINGPKIDMIIVFKLGQLFVSRAQDVVKPIDKTFLEARAESIYKYGLNMMKMHNKGVLEPFRKYFKYYKSQSSAAERELTAAAEDAVSYLAARYFKKSEYEDLIDELGGIRLPLATYMQAEAYRKLDEASKTPKKTKRMYLDRANECLNQTLALLKSSSHADPNHPLNSVIHSEIKKLQQASARYLSDTNTNFSPLAGLNNSSTYEDAEADFYAENSIIPPASLLNTSRVRRESMSNATTLISNHNQEMENLVKQLTDTFKQELGNVTKEMSTLKEKIANLEDAVKKIRVSSNPPSRDDASNVLDDLYLIEDTLQHQLYQQHQPPSTGHMNSQQYPNTAGSVTNGASMLPNSSFMTQQQRLQAAAFNSSMFPPTHNFPMNFYGHPNQPNPYIMAPQSAAPPPPINQRPCPLPALPYLDPTVPPAPTGLNFNMSATSTPLLPPPTQPQHPPPVLPVDPNKPSSLYNLLQQINPNISNPIPPPPTMGNYSTTPLSLSSITMPPPTVNPSPINVAPTATIQAYKPVEKTPPANVVITNSDPLPNPNTIAVQAQQQVALSVTIPSHHIKPSLVSQPPPPPAVEMAPLINKAVTSNPTTSFSNTFGVSIATSTFSFKPQVAAAAAQAANSSHGSTAAVNGENLNKTSESLGSDFNRSATEDHEYDPRPDFKPIIPLPDEIEVRTGEEDEEVMFCHKAKLYRFVDKEWKERGIGDIKILKNKEGCCRILMRRDQTHKICANHVITPELGLTEPKNDKKKGFIWAALDFADETSQLEKFFVRFKFPETAKQFQEAFKNAQTPQKEKQNAGGTVKKVEEDKSKNVSSIAADKAAPFSLAKSNVTNFFTSTPAQKSDTTVAPAIKSVFGQPLISATTSTTPATVTNAASKSLFSGLNLSTKSSDSSETSNKPVTTAAPSPFANFTFGKTQAPSGISTSVAPATNLVNASPFASIFSNLSTSPFTNTTITNTPAIIPTTVNEAVMNKSAASDNEDDYVPTAQFNPVIPLPDLVEVNTGEENELVLFEHRSKLLRFDKEAGEWKERGLGNIKLLQDKDDVNKVRLVMRREQIHKLCCNQRIYKDTTFKYMNNSKTAVSWAGQDFSENELVTEMLTVRFKLPETCKEFLEAIQQSQAKMNSDGKEANSKANEKKKESEPDSNKPIIKGFGEAFKPKAGAWSCEACYISNDADQLYCVACDTPRDSTVPKKESNSDILATKSTTKFNFGFGTSTPSTATAEKPLVAAKNSTFGLGAATLASTNSAETKSKESAPIQGFGDLFKPKAGSWSCQSCYLSNNNDAVYCKACDAPKDDTVPKKEANANILSLSNPTQKYSFGFGTPAVTSSLTDNTNKSVGTGFSFNAAPVVGTDNTTTTTMSTTANTASIGKSTFTFSLSSKAMELPATTGSGEDSTPNTFSLDKKEFSFTMKPKSPGKTGKSPMKFRGGDADLTGEDDGEADYDEEEENNAYFTPVIPLPDKIDVKTGEEDEELLYVHRAKLYRFTDGEWKERGLGNLKILRHKEDKKLRIVMRREQVLKICLNHVLNKDVDYKRKDDKSWLFVVNDFSEGAVELEKFSLRFKTKEVAEEFMENVTKALDGTAVAIEPEANLSIVTPSNTEPPASVLDISEEDKKTADKLKLPYEFYSSKTTCPGCRGCDPDKFVFADVNNMEPFINEEDTQNQLVVMELPVLTAKKTSSGSRLLLKQSTLFSPPSNNPMETKGNDNIFSAFGGANSTAFSSTTTASEKSTSATFSFTAAVNNTNKSPDETKTFGTAGSGGFLFGAPATIGTNNTMGSLFGGGKETFGNKPLIFGGAATTNSATKLNEATDGADKTSTKSIFSGSSATSGSIFGGKLLFGNPTPTFGSSSSNDAIKSTFESSTNTPIFGGFGSSSQTLPQFGSAATKDKNAASNSAQAGDKSLGPFDLSNTETPPLDFATLAKSSSNINPFTQTVNEKTEPGGFVGMTQRNAFSGFQNTSSGPTNTTFSDLSKGSANSVQAGEKSPAPFDLSNTAVASLDFATLAKASPNAKPFTQNLNEKPGPGGFIGLTHRNAFSSFEKPSTELSASNKKTSNNKANDTQKSNGSGEESGDHNDDTYDPHYDAIIELPAEIVVSTGEEEETKLFGERATLYRWDATNKEWKERGVGELKILSHPVKKSFRLVMRREQIHKLILNHAVNSDLHFTSMNNNPKSFVWATLNYAESSEGELEKLAVRFRNVELAEAFSKHINECILASQKSDKN